MAIFMGDDFWRKGINCLLKTTMNHQIIDGKKIAQELKNQITAEIKSLSRKPGLAVVLIGDDSASQIYVNSKEEACQEVGFYSQKIVMPVETTQEELIKQIERLNQDEKIDGILVQMPLPSHLDEKTTILAIDPKKDVDCFHPINLGELVLQKKALPMSQLLASCTPKGIMRLIHSTQVELVGKKAVVVGRSHLVGKPVALLLLAENATVQICHSKTTDLATECRSADILVAAVGVPNLITANMIKPGAVVIDVGINRVDGKLVGDVDFEQVKQVAGFITPVPGGVGPMTIASLLENTLLLARRR